MAASKGTCGGKAVKMKDWEVRLGDILDNVLVERCEGAVDTLDPFTFTSEEPASKRPAKKSTGRPERVATYGGKESVVSLEGMMRKTYIGVPTHINRPPSQRTESAVPSTASAIHAAKDVHRKRLVESTHCSTFKVSEKRRKETEVEEFPRTCRAEVAAFVNISDSDKEYIQDTSRDDGKDLRREERVVRPRADSKVTPIEDSKYSLVADYESEDSHHSVYDPMSSRIPVAQHPTTGFEAQSQTFAHLEDSSRTKLQTGQGQPSASHFQRFASFARDMEDSQEAFRRTVEENLRGIRDAMVALIDELRQQRQLQTTTNRDIATILSGILATQDRVEKNQARMSNALEQLALSQQQTASVNVLIATSLQNLL
ncbi:uncharacterized protein LOC142106824 isoform X2 [Mixophyes fleayi]